MKILQNRAAASLIAAVVIVLGTLLGVRISVGREAHRIEALFYNGLTDPYPQPSIASQLEKRVTAARGLIAVADNYNDLSALTDDMRRAREELIDAKTISEKYAANTALQSAYKKLYAELSKRDLKENELASTSTYAQQLEGAQGVIDKSGYNKIVDQFVHETLEELPVVLLKDLVSVTYPEYFGAGR